MYRMMYIASDGPVSVRGDATRVGDRRVVVAVIGVD